MDFETWRLESKFTNSYLDINNSGIAFHIQIYFKIGVDGPF